MNKFFLITLLFIFFLLGCQEETPIKEPVSWTKEQSTSFGRSIAEQEELDIKLFLKQRKHWELQQTGTGLRYWVYEGGDGNKPVAGNTVDVSFEVRLLDDSLCYKTEDHEVSTFMVDKSDVETGVQEGIKLMNEGGKAKFIIPSHLGHGLVGDFNRVPPLQVLVIDIHLIRIR